MKWDIATGLGLLHPDFLDERLTDRQYLELVTYYSLCPFGAKRDDWNFANLASMIYHSTPRKNSATMKLDKFRLKFNEPKVKGETRIPTGRYQVLLRNEGRMTKRYAKRFSFHQGMLWLQDVPDFQFIYIHVGNKDDDSEGCLLVGDGQISNVVERGQVTNSVTAYKRLYDKIVKALPNEEVWIEIEDFA